MSQIADITLPKVTGSTVFTVIGTQSGDDTPARWKGPGSAIAAPRLRALTRRVKNAAKSKVQINLDFPIVSTDAGGLETLNAAGHVNITIDLPDNFTEDMRLDVCANAAALFSNVIIQDLIAKDSPAY